MTTTSTGTVFADEDTLNEYLQGLNDEGRDPDVALLDARGILWLTYGEERSTGGEAMTCWLLSGDPWGDGGEHQWSPCEDCGTHGIEPIPLRRANYPVTVIHDGAR